jgi:hypothetical protein
MEMIMELGQFLTSDFGINSEISSLFMLTNKVESVTWPQLNTFTDEPYRPIEPVNSSIR